MKVVNLARRASLLPSIALTVFTSGLSLPSFASYSDTGTLTVDEKVGGCGRSFYAADGYLENPGGMGSYSPSGLTGGKTVAAIFDYPGGSACNSVAAWFEVNGFSGDPGKGWLISVTCNGVTNYGSSAGYSYSSGGSAWYWPTLFGLSSKLYSSVSCTIVHN